MAFIRGRANSMKLKLNIFNSPLYYPGYSLFAGGQSWLSLCIAQHRLPT
jgi:hypothetical protein